MAAINELSPGGSGCCASEQLQLHDGTLKCLSWLTQMMLENDGLRPAELHDSRMFECGDDAILSWLKVASSNYGALSNRINFGPGQVYEPTRVMVSVCQAIIAFTTNAQVVSKAMVHNATPSYQK